MTAFTEPVAPPAKKRAVQTVGDAMRIATSVLKRPGNLPLLIASLLFLSILLITWVTVMQLIAIPMELLAQAAGNAQWATILLDSLHHLLSIALLLVGVMPVALGRVRLAGRMCLGEMPAPSELFYYYTSPNRFVRGITMGFALLLEVMIPIGIVWGLFSVTFGLYTGLLLVYLEPWAALLLLLLGLLVSAAISLLIAPLGIFYMLSTAFAVGNENVSVLRSVWLAIRYTVKNLGTVILFTLRALLHLLLSLCTVGVLHLLWYGHHYIISYLCLTMALDQGE